MKTERSGEIKDIGQRRNLDRQLAEPAIPVRSESVFLGGKMTGIQGYMKGMGNECTILRCCCCSLLVRTILEM